MAYEITDKVEGGSVVMSEAEAEAKFGSAELTEMVVEVHPRYVAHNTSVDADAGNDFYIDDEDDCDISAAFN